MTTHSSNISNVVEHLKIFCVVVVIPRVVASFSHKIQFEYYDGHISVYIEGPAMEHFSAPTYKTAAETPQSSTHNTVFHNL